MLIPKVQLYFISLSLGLTLVSSPAWGEDCVSQVLESLPSAIETRKAEDTISSAQSTIRSSQLIKVDRGSGKSFSYRVFNPEHRALSARNRAGSAQQGEVEPILISPGFKESSTKYAEVVYDLQAQGFNPIYVVNHRGQGPNDPFHPQIRNVLRNGPPGTYAHPADIDKFSDMSEDLKEIADQVYKDTGKNPHLVAHSMGTVVAVRAMQLHGDNFKINSVTLLAPVFEVHKSKLFDWKRDLLDNDRRKAIRPCYAPIGANPYCLECWSRKVDSPEEVTRNLTRFALGQPGAMNPLGSSSDLQHRLCGSLSFLGKYDQERKRMTSIDGLSSLRMAGKRIQMILADGDSYVENGKASKVCDEINGRGMSGVGEGQCRAVIVSPRVQIKAIDTSRKCLHELLMESDECRSSSLAEMICHMRGEKR